MPYLARYSFYLSNHSWSCRCDSLSFVLHSWLLLMNDKLLPTDIHGDSVRTIVEVPQRAILHFNSHVITRHIDNFPALNVYLFCRGTLLARFRLLHLRCCRQREGDTKSASYQQAP